MADRRYITKRLHQAGASLGIYIPKPYVTALALSPKSDMLMYMVGGVICLQPVKGETFVPGVIGVAPRAPEE